MKHDEKCELRNPRPLYLGPSCQCASRACPLCDGCKSGLHLRHTPVVEGDGVPCGCDLCEVSA